MADSCSETASQYCCAGCVRNVKRAMLKVEGVHSIKVNGSEGTMEVKSEIDPQELIKMAAEAGKRAELLWESKPESSEYISTANTPPPAATPSTNLASQRHVQISHFDGFDQTVNLQDLVDKNARGIEHMEIIDKSVVKIMFKESHDDPGASHSRNTSPIAPLSPDPQSSGGGGEASGPGGNVKVVAAPSPATEPSSSMLPEIHDAPLNSNPAEPPVANVYCSNKGRSCIVM